MGEVDEYVLQGVRGERMYIPAGGLGERMRDRLLGEGWVWENKPVSAPQFDQVLGAVGRYLAGLPDSELQIEWLRAATVEEEALLLVGPHQVSAEVLLDLVWVEKQARRVQAGR